MKALWKSSLVCLALGCTPFVSAQLLHNFTSFQSPDTTVFVGDWALNGDTTVGDANPIATFFQGPGFYDFAGGTNADTSGVYYFLPNNPGDLTGYGLLEVSGRLLGGNTAQNFAVTLLNFASGEYALAVFATADFAGPGYATVTATLTTSGFFNPAAVDAFLIGGVSGGADMLNFSIDNLAALVAVPEPSTYGLVVAALTFIGVAAFRRLRRPA